MSLTFGYSTLSSRLGNIKLPDYKSKNWDVLITVQSGNESEPDLSKAPAGVRVLGFPGRGVTKLRNKVIENSNTDYLIFSDDDVEFVGVLLGAPAPDEPELTLLPVLRRRLSQRLRPGPWRQIGRAHV